MQISVRKYFPAKEESFELPNDHAKLWLKISWKTLSAVPQMTNIYLFQNLF